VPGIESYWLRDKNVPFATFLGMMQSYYHPEIRNDMFGKLLQRARASEPDDVQMATFKQELVRLLEGDREGLHPEAVETATDYDDWDTDDEFLMWLWQQLYPDEPVPGHHDSAPSS
jgi:hypothetical protein